MIHVSKFSKGFFKVECGPHSLSLYLRLQTHSAGALLLLSTISSHVTDQLAFGYYLGLLGFLLSRSLCQPHIQNISYLIVSQFAITYLLSADQECSHIHNMTILAAIAQQLLTYSHQSLSLKGVLWLLCLDNLRGVDTQEQLKVMVVTLVLLLAKKTYFIQQTDKLSDEAATAIQRQAVENSHSPMLFIDSTCKIIRKNRQCQALDSVYQELFHSQPKDFRDLLCAQDVRKFHQLMRQSLKEKKASAYMQVMRTQHDVNQSCSINESMKTNESTEEKQKYHQKEVTVMKVVSQGRLYYVVTLEGKGAHTQIRHMQKTMNQSMITICNDLMESILQDFSKWNNLRSLKVIKESDLQALAQCISKLNTLRHFLINNQEMSNVRQHRKVALQKQCFHIKNAVIQCMELLSIQTMQIEGFMLNLKFEDSFPIYVVGDIDKFKHIIIQIMKHMQDYMQGQKHAATISSSIKLFCKLKQYDNDTNNFRLTFEFHVKDNEKLFESFQEIMGREPVDFNHIKPNFENLSLIGSVLLPHIVAFMEGSMRLERAKDSAHFQVILEMPFKNENQLQCVSQSQTVNKGVSSATLQKQGMQNIIANENLKIKPNISPLSFCRLQLKPNNYNWKKKVCQEEEKKFTINKREQQPAGVYGTLCKNQLNRFQLYKDNSTPHVSDIQQGFKTASLNSVQEKPTDKAHTNYQSENLNVDKNKSILRASRDKIKKITIVSQESKEEEIVEKNFSDHDMTQPPVGDECNNVSEFQKPQKTKTFACNLQTSSSKTLPHNDRLKVNTEMCLMNEKRLESPRKQDATQTPIIKNKSPKNMQPSPLSNLDSTTKKYLQERNKRSRHNTHTSANKEKRSQNFRKSQFVNSIPLYSIESNDQEVTEYVMSAEGIEEEIRLQKEFEEIYKINRVFEQEKILERHATLQQHRNNNYKQDLKLDLLSVVQNSQQVLFNINYTKERHPLPAIDFGGSMRSLKKKMNKQCALGKMKQLKRIVTLSTPQPQSDNTSRHQESNNSNFVQNILNENDSSIIIRRQQHFRLWNKPT